MQSQCANDYYVPPHMLPYGFAHCTWETVNMADCNKFVCAPEITVVTERDSNVSARRHEEDNEHAERVRVPSVYTALQVQQTRTTRGLTQSCLARIINEKVGLIKDLEARRCMPPPLVVSKIERALGIRLACTAKK